MKVNTPSHVFHPLTINKMVEQSYSDIDSLIVKDNQDNVYFLCNGLYLVNGQIQPSPFNAIQEQFNRAILRCRWCEWNGEIVEMFSFQSYELVD